MKITKTKGFSLAELMIALLVISVALAASAPTITKSILGSDTIWKPSVDNTGGTQSVDSDTIFFNGPNLLIGTQRLPNFKRAKRYFPEAISTSNFDFSPKSDKLVIMGNLADGGSLSSSHIAFYNQEGNADATYAGRLASDKYNLALGIGSLQSLVQDLSNRHDLKGVYNTAIGHYTLFANKKGSYNTALGYKALEGATGGLFDRDEDYAPSYNIALGDHALQRVGGNNNIAIGSHAGRHLQGSNNLVIGTGAGNLITGSNNLLITPVKSYNRDNTNILTALRGHRGNSNYPFVTHDDNFAIGLIDAEKVFANSVANDPNNKYLPPEIQGFTRTRCGDRNIVGVDNTCNADNIIHGKGIIINADRFNVKTADGEQPIFSVLDGLNLGSWGSPRNIITAEYILNPTATGYSATAPCNGAPICLAKFDAITASYYTDNDRDGLAGNDYTVTGTFPRFRRGIGDENNDTALPNSFIYDLFIGSIDYRFTDGTYSSNFAEENNLVAQINNGIDHSGNTLFLIDVGQERNTVNIRSDKMANVLTADAISPTIIVNNLTNGTPNPNYRGSLKIRTVKTAVNYLDEMKETAGGLDYLNQNITNLVRCLFNTSPDEDLSSCLVNTSSTTGNKTILQQIVDPQDHTIMCRLADNTILLNAAVKLIGGLNYCDPQYINTPSDARLKNISGDNTAGIKEINKLNVVNYTYKADKAKTPHVGVIAQELKKVFPNAVKKGSDGYYRIRLEDMFYAMINSVQQLSDRKDNLDELTVDYIDTPLSELQKQNADIKAQNELLKQKNAEMEKRLSKLETK